MMKVYKVTERVGLYIYLHVCGLHELFLLSDQYTSAFTDALSVYQMCKTHAHIYCEVVHLFVYKGAPYAIANGLV